MRMTLRSQARHIWKRSESLEGAEDMMMLSDMPRNPKVFLDIESEREKLGRITIQLDSEKLPKAAENFVSLCTGQRATYGGEGHMIKRSLKRGNLHYKGTNFHRVLPGFLIQGGDNEHYDGTGGYCSFKGYKHFEDESYDIPFDSEGVVGMAVSGPNRNGSQFFITTAPAPHLQNKCVAIGKVISGMEVVTAIEGSDVDHNDRPIQHIEITSCGIANE